MSQNKVRLTEVRLTEKPKLSAHRQARRIREWAAAYRLWNERELERPDWLERYESLVQQLVA